MALPRPLLQVALDTKDLNTALKTTRLVSDVVDVIEVGTILCLAEGLGAITSIRTLYPNKLILADVRIAEAGAIIAKMVFDAQANWVSMLSSASLSTMEAVAKEAFSRGGDVQVELQDDWSLQKANAWLALGIKQVTIHRSRDAEVSHPNWDEKSIQQIRDLADQGFKVSVTGKLSTTDIPLFKGIPVFAFVAGRAIREAQDPHAAAQHFMASIRENWN